jgi:hypothetical protein
MTPMIEPWTIGMLLLLLFTIVPLVILHVLLVIGAREAAAILDEPDMRTESINGLPLPLAIHYVEEMLRDPRRTAVEASVPIESGMLRHLPRLAADFFRNHGDVGILTSDAAAAVGPSYFHLTSDRELLIIGGTEDGSVGLVQSEETIFFVWPRNPGQLEKVAPTLYHWLLQEDPGFSI